MKRRLFLLVAAGIAMVSGVLLAPSASAGQLCYDLDVNVAGNQLVDQAGCQDLPDAP